ncbi:[acyl-carrier-protein] S-malonyltransferase [bacterium]|nr:MAG: [acyl-carrier-protein] S-malonyltransferase [bacterium]
MVAFLFPGQGSQYAGMGKDLYEAYPAARAVFDKADSIVGFSLSRLCFDGPLTELTRTQNCQPAVLTASIAALEALKAVINHQSPVASFAAGLSLGEYSALIACGVLSFEDGLRLVWKRAMLMEEAAKKHQGKMCAVLGLERSLVQEICRESQAEIANLNCPGQIVITGTALAVDKAKGLAEEKGAKRVLDLEVSGAFHSGLMREAAEEFRVFSQNTRLKDAAIPLVSNVTAGPLQNPLEIRENMVKQIYSPVRWEDSVRFIIGQGVKTFYEIGPGSVLKGLLRKIDPGAQVINIGKREEIDNFKS